jgi:hypothetical protein
MLNPFLSYLSLLFYPVSSLSCSLLIVRYRGTVYNGFTRVVFSAVMEWLGTNGVSLFLSGLILALGSYFIRLRVSQKLHTSSQVVVGAIVGSLFCILWYTMWNSLLREAFEASLLVQISVFLFAATFALAFAAYVVLNWFKDER